MPSPLDLHAASPRELQARIAAERRGTPFLLYRDRGDAQVIVELGEVPERLTIGRRPTNTVVLDWDSEVSRVHAALERIGDDWTLADDGLSHNGTYLNGRRLSTRARLRDGDTIGVGAVAIAFRAPDDGAPSRPTATALHAHVGEAITPAQRRVLLALCRPFAASGYAVPPTNQQIAEELVVSVDTVKSTLRALFEAFRLGDLPQNHKRASLALAALRAGVVTRRELDPPA